MAAIDKLRLGNHQDYVTLIKWATVYKPSLLFSMTINLSYEEWTKWQKEIIKGWFEGEKNTLKRIGINTTDFTDEEFIEAYVEYHKTFYLKNKFIVDSECIKSFYDDAKRSLENRKKLVSKEKWELLDCAELPIANFSFKQDRYLKWHCPIDKVREYLHEQCGVKSKFEWFYRLFFKGAKYV